MKKRVKFDNIDVVHIELNFDLPSQLLKTVLFDYGFFGDYLQGEDKPSHIMQDCVAFAKFSLPDCLQNLKF